MAKFELVYGDLLEQHVDVIVNAWNRNLIPWWLLIPQGVSGAIKRKAGLKPFLELPFGPIPLGNAVITSSGRLTHKAIIHVAGINMLWRASKESIQNSVVNAIKLAGDSSFKSIALPIIGAGSGSFNQNEAQKLMEEAIGFTDSDLRIIIVKFEGKSYI